MKSFFIIFISLVIVICYVTTPLYCENSLPDIYDDLELKTRNIKFDFSTLAWIEAFDSLHACLSLRYPFTEWKAIDWVQKGLETRPKIFEAQDTNDLVKYIQTLFEYLYDVPDGHINLLGDVDPFKQNKLAGTYGFNMMPISDGSVVATLVAEGSPAYENGLRTGDRIVAWKGVDIDSVPQRELWNYFRNYATEEGRLISRYTMLSRDALGAHASISYQSHETGLEETITLLAFEDEFELFIIAVFNTSSPLLFESWVEYKIMPSGNGYLRIGAEDSDAITPEGIMESETFKKIVEAITYFNNNDVSNLVVDLRFNLGGNDLMAAVIMGLFYEEESFYEYITGTYDDDYAILYALWVESIMPRFDGNIVTLIDPNCISTGEGLAMMLKRLENGQIISSWGTNGSFGIVDYDPVFMPEGLVVTFPQARSLDENFIIQIDSDSTLAGGVVPDIRIPLTIDNIIAQWQENRDVQLEYADSILVGAHGDHETILLYPNPCSNQLKLKIFDGFKTKCNIAFYDIRGRFLYEQEISYGSIGEVMHLDTGKLKSGLYFYRISDGVNEHVGKMLCIK